VGVMKNFYNYYKKGRYKDMEEIIRRIENIMVECGNIIINANYNDLKIKNKEGNSNIVTNYDRLIQEKLKNELLDLLPEAVFIGEESDKVNDVSKIGYTFIVDPIDGTTNFSLNIKMSAISVALLKDGEPILGLCYNPYLKEMYKAEKNNGAYLNNQKIHVSSKNLKNGIVLCGCAPYYNDLRNKSLEIQKKFSMVASDYRRFGSAVIELCNIASGKAEVYFELKLQPWDYAAAGLILEEAGGKITTIEGNKIQYNNSTSIIASNGVEDYLKYIF
jgi:myo-inositol-1(or 4)-monophosphatase